MSDSCRMYDRDYREETEKNYMPYDKCVLREPYKLLITLIRISSREFKVEFDYYSYKC